jgi:hypothetical protein
MQKPDKFIPALYGGLIMGVISAIPFVNLVNCLCCAGVLLGGFLAVFFYKSNFTPDTQPYSAGDCLAVGALAGVLGAFVSVVLASISVMIFGDVMREFMLRFLEEGGLDIPEDVMEEIRRAIEEAPTGMESVLFDLLFSLIIYPIFGLLGGLIGYGVWKPKPPMIESYSQQM